MKKSKIAWGALGLSVSVEIAYLAIKGLNDFRYGIFLIIPASFFIAAIIGGILSIKEIIEGLKECYG